tara:strand:+ start:650 stop:799 length:150 start_codon:yes stop_codon:yes gene_type:complete
MLFTSKNPASHGIITQEENSNLTNEIDELNKRIEALEAKAERLISIIDG